MKKVLYTYALIFAVSLFTKGAYGQSYATSIGATAGYAEDGIGANISLNIHLDRYSFIQVGVFGSTAEESSNGLDIPFSIVSLQPGYFRRVLLINNPKTPIGFYLGAGAIGGYEVVNNGEEELPTGAILDAKSKFIYGGFVGAELDISLSETFSLAVKAHEHYHANSDIGKVYPYVGVGVRYYLN